MASDKGFLYLIIGPTGKRYIGITNGTAEKRLQEQSPEHREKNRLSHLGQLAAFKGRKHSEETRAKMRAAWVRRRGG